MRVITVDWGVDLLGEAALCTVLVVTLSTGRFLLVSPVFLYGMLGSLGAWMVLYSRQGRAEERRMRAAELRISAYSAGVGMTCTTH